MAELPSGTLGGYQLFGRDRLGWWSTRGIRPYQRIFELASADAKDLLEKSAGGTVILRLRRGDREKVVKRLRVLGTTPARDDDRIGLVIADGRASWPDVPIRRELNIRRRSGERRLVDGVLQRIDAALDVTFAKFSMKDEKEAWSPRTALEDVLREVTGGLFRIEPSVRWVEALTLEELRLFDPGDRALERLLALVPGLGVWLDDDGTAVIDQAGVGLEEAELAKAPPVVHGTTRAQLCDLSSARASDFSSLFRVEEEVRFDFFDGGVPSTTSNEPRTLENVMPLPFPLEIAGRGRCERGTWVPIDQALLDAFNTTPCTVYAGGRSKTFPPITFADIRALWLVPGGYCARLEGTSGDPRWALIWLAIYKHYRQTFRISRRWADRCHEFRVTRLALVDPESGTRAPADVFADHAYLPSAARIARALDDPTIDMAVNHFAWPEGENPGTVESGTRSAAVTVAEEDADAFVFRLQFHVPVGQLGMQGVVCSALDETTMPKAKPSASLAQLLAHKAKLLAAHRVSVILTLAPASPQGRDGMYAIKVTPEEAGELLPEAIRARAKRCVGPPRGHLIGPQLAAARFAWKDSAAEEIEGAVLGGGPRSQERLLNPEALRDVARAAAASHYSALADRWEGSHATDFTPELRPRGRIQAVKHELDREAVFTTELDLAPPGPGLQVEALLSASTRSLLLKKVQP